MFDLRYWFSAVAILLNHLECFLKWPTWSQSPEILVYYELGVELGKSCVPQVTLMFTQRREPLPWNIQLNFRLSLYKTGRGKRKKRVTVSTSYPSVLILSDQGQGAGEDLDFASCAWRNMAECADWRKCSWMSQCGSISWPGVKGMIGYLCFSGVLFDFE